MYLDDDEVELALRTLRGQQFKLWLATRYKNITNESDIVGRAFVEYGLSSDVCARYRSTVLLDDVSWENYYGLYKLVVGESGIGFWKVCDLCAWEPTLRPKTVVRCALRYAAEQGYGREEMEILEMMLRFEMDRLG